MSSSSNVRDTENPRKIEFNDLDASIVKDSGRKLLREYSGILEEEIDSHVEEIRAKAFKVWPYPCIGMFRFLDLSLMTTDIYQEILERVKHDEKFLDLGCCFGQEIRQLVFDGAPAVNTYGSDLWGEFISIGYELFKDKDRLQTNFITADVFDDSSPLTKLAGQMNIIYTGAFFHLFNLEEQEKIALRIVQLLVPQPGSLIIGQQSGSEIPGEYSRSSNPGGQKHFRHNPQSWKELWDRVGEKTGSRWSVEADLRFPEFTLSVPKGGSTAMQNGVGSKGLRFIVKRL